MKEPLEELLQIAALKKNERVTPFVLEYLTTCKQYLKYGCLDVDYVLQSMKDKYIRRD